MGGSVQNLGPLGSAFLTFIGYKQTPRHPKYLYRYIFGFSVCVHKRQNGKLPKNLDLFLYRNLRNNFQSFSKFYSSLDPNTPFLHRKEVSLCR